MPEEVSNHLEYQAPSGDRWRVEDGGSLLVEFGLESADQLPAWHRAMAGQGRPWEVLRRYFGLAPVLASAEDSGQWPIEKITKQFGLSYADVEAELDHALAFWAQRNLVTGVAEQARASSRAADGAGDGDESPTPSTPAVSTTAGLNPTHAQSLALTDPHIDEILSSHGFDDVEDAVERRMVASRLIHFEDLLAEPKNHALVTNAIRAELDLAYLNRELSEERRKAKKSGTGSRKAVTDLIKERDRVLSSLSDTLEELGATEAQRGATQKRVDFQDCLGHVIRAVQRYYAEGDNALIDGMHTAAEINFALHPVAERPIPYDPQMVIEVFHAQQHLWDAEFEGHRLNRNASRRLRAAFKEAIETMNEKAGITARSLEDDAADAVDVDEELARTAESSALSAGESAAATADQQSAVAQQQQAWRQVNRQAESLVAAG